ncbi:LysR substrate-binding domain-containing protein [Novosphingobium resinovorum]|uniref:LysR substrate-binding domain-containing protein n=1 Tax=Novosphingobium resinovorum TaxID=158500 RepID=UPI002ED0763A|nr:LysR substrate-binding domain-containing protein [Novosphingobium resinovorum]
MYRPPSIQTLRAFEAAARLNSFSRAAEELGITHGAVSHRIREIEERLGTTMFERRGNSMEPTVAARQMLPVVRQSLELIASVFPPPASGRQQILRIGVLPSFAANWLVPRLQGFHTAHPGIAIALDPRLEASRIGPRGVDAAIRYGSGRWPGLVAERLIQDRLFPACSPMYRERMAITGIADLGRCHLLRNSWHPWTPWFQKAGLAMAEPADSVPYDDAGLLMEAVLAGHGVGLVRKVIVNDALASGQLIRLSPVEVPFDGAYHYTTTLHGTAKDDAIRLFGDWLKDRLLEEFPALP